MRALAIACVFAAACGSQNSNGGSGDDVGDDAGASDGGGNDDGGGGGDGGDDGGGGSDGGGNGGFTPPQAVPLVACGSTVDIAPPVSTALPYYLPAGVPPFEVSGDRVQVFYPSTSQVLGLAHATGQTVPWATQLAGATNVVGDGGMTGRTALKFYVGTTAYMSLVGDGTSLMPSLSAPIELPCNDILNYSACEVRVAGDGHAWVSKSGQLYEQTGTTFEHRGGAPVTVYEFDVAWNGDVLVMGAAGQDLVQIWKLPVGSAGWTKVGSVTRPDLGTIPSGVAFDGAMGAFAQDGSIHLFTSANYTYGFTRTVVYLRSQNGTTWTAESIPDINVFTDGQTALGNVAIWASDYNNVRFATISRYSASSGTRRISEVARCTSNGQPAFERIAQIGADGNFDDTARAHVRFSATGVLTVLATYGPYAPRLTQVYR